MVVVDETEPSAEPADVVVIADQTEPSAETPPPLPEVLHRWRRFETFWYPDGKWSTWHHGIVDLKALWPLKPNCSEGTLLKTAVKRAKHVLDLRDAVFKIGICTCLATRWLMYRDHHTSKWPPSHLFVLLTIPGRTAAGWAEAALIREMRSLLYPGHHNINLLTHDGGGTGPRTFENADRLLYLAARPTPGQLGHF